ncbi:hypothetical protein [Massilia brevitalea]|uniref:hypothetical protein n=1 Tax=Massilia brevitalea TaxID=442526 RepID=UPI0027391E88|nr:hypothetical protein [Massilia brevitalea]
MEGLLVWWNDGCGVLIFGRIPEKKRSARHELTMTSITRTDQQQGWRAGWQGLQEQ